MTEIPVEVDINVDPDLEKELLEWQLPSDPRKPTGNFLLSPLSVEDTRKVLADRRHKSGELLKYLLHWDGVSKRALKESKFGGWTNPSTDKELASICAKVSPFLKENGVNIKALKPGTDIAKQVMHLYDRIIADYLSDTYSLVLFEFCLAEPLGGAVENCLVAGKDSLQAAYDKSKEEAAAVGRMKEPIELDILLERERLFNKSIRREITEVEKNYKQLVEVAKLNTDITLSSIALYVNHVQALAEKGFSFEEVKNCYDGDARYFGKEAHQNQKFDGVRDYMQQLKTAKNKGRITEGELQAIYNYVGAIISFNKAKKDALRYSNSTEFMTASSRISAKYDELNKLNAKYDLLTEQVEMIGSQITSVNKYLNENRIVRGLDKIEGCIPMAAGVRKA